MGLFRYTSRTLAREVLLIAVGGRLRRAVLHPDRALAEVEHRDRDVAALDPAASPLAQLLADVAGDVEHEHHDRPVADEQHRRHGRERRPTRSARLGLRVHARAEAVEALGRALPLFVAGIVVPFQLGVIPLYVALREYHLIGTYFGMILLHGGLLMPLTVFLYAGFIRALPREYEEAAQVDGAGLIRTLVQVVLPLLRPITGTVAVLTGLFCWNDFFLPLIFLSGSKNQTLPVAVFQFVGNYTEQWNLIFPTVVIALARWPSSTCSPRSS